VLAKFFAGMTHGPSSGGAAEAGGTGGVCAWSAGEQIKSSNARIGGARRTNNA
jgi:hypothetical protein